MTQRYKVDVLDYIITNNHVHLLIKIKDGSEVSEGLRYLHGRMGQWYNIQTDQSGSFWGDRFHATRIQSGKHLGACLFYIDLNMVRAGVVDHPSQWEYGSYNEFTGKTQRCCIINKEQLLNSLCFDNDFSRFTRWYQATLEDELGRMERNRQAFWSQATAVGDKEWLHGEAQAMRVRRVIVSHGSNEQYYLGNV